MNFTLFHVTSSSAEAEQEVEEGRGKRTSQPIELFTRSSNLHSSIINCSIISLHSATLLPFFCLQHNMSRRQKVGCVSHMSSAILNCLRLQTKTTAESSYSRSRKLNSSCLL